MSTLFVGLLASLSEVERLLIFVFIRDSLELRRNTGGNLGGIPKTNAKKVSLVLRLRKEG